jgi:hypothetical protein
MMPGLNLGSCANHVLYHRASLSFERQHVPMEIWELVKLGVIEDSL